MVSGGHVEPELPNNVARPPEITPPRPTPGPPTFIVTRPDDLVLLAVTFHGFTAAPGGFMAGASASLVVTFPSQAAQEQRVASNGALTLPAPAGFAGRSTVQLDVAAGTLVPTTVPGVLAAIDGQPIATSASNTAVELPVGLVLVPLAAAAGETVTARHVTAAPDLGGTAPVWQTELTAPSGLSANPIRTTNSSWSTEPNSGPLYPSQAELIVANAAIPDPATGQAVPARVDRMRLSALGGTLTAQGSWPDISWQHDMALGRDRRVQVSQRGVLLPFGHTALLVEIAERTVGDTGDGGIAPMQSRATLYIDPVRTYPTDDAWIRTFPFHRVDILTSTVEGLDAVDPDPSGGQPHFIPAQASTPVEFPVRLFGTAGPVDVTMQLMFVGTQTQPAGMSGAGEQPHDVAPDDISVDVIPPDGLTVPPVAVPAVPVDLVRAAVPLPADIHVVHQLEFVTELDDANTYRPLITKLHVDLPAVRAMLPPGANTLVQAVLSQDLVSRGAQADKVLDQLAPLGADGLPSAANLAVSFTDATQRAGALVNPSFVADTVERTLGPVKSDLLNATKDVLAGLPPFATILHDALGDARLLGLKLTDLLDSTVLKGLPIPAIVHGVKTAEQIASGTPPTAKMTWSGLPLISTGSFLSGITTGAATLDLHVTVGPDDLSVSCTVFNFNLVLPDSSNALLKLKFPHVTFTATKGKPPTLDTKGVSASFGGALKLLQTLEGLVDLGDAGQIIKVNGDNITAAYSQSLPEVAAGMFDLRNIDFRSSIVVPLSDKPVSVAVSFASRDNPFTVAVLAFGGGGYIDLLLDGTGLQHFEGSLDFGAQLAVNFVVAAGEVHAFGGVRFTVENGTIDISAFLRFGGSLQILGVVTVSVEVSIELTYVDDEATTFRNSPDGRRSSSRWT